MHRASHALTWYCIALAAFVCTYVGPTTAASGCLYQNIKRHAFGTVHSIHSSYVDYIVLVAFVCAYVRPTIAAFGCVYVWNHIPREESKERSKGRRKGKGSNVHARHGPTYQLTAKGCSWKWC